MAPTTTNLTPDDLRTLESTRQKLYQITNSIHSLKNDILHSNPLPPWSTIQTQSRIISVALKGVTDELSKNADFFNRTVVFPSTNYPGRTQEGILQQLLRKKLEPQVENWVEEGRTTAEDEGAGSKTEDEFLGEARIWFSNRIRTYVEDESAEYYTAEEKEIGIEKVNTGLKADYEDESDEEDETDEKDTGMAVTSARRTSLGQFELNLGQVKRAAGQANSMDDILRFATTGATMDLFSGGRR